MAVWLHALVAAMGVAMGTYADGRLASALIIASIGYASWVSGRGLGLGFAFVAAALRLVGVDQPHSAVLVDAGLWLGAYVAVALVASAIETGTRPDPE